LHQGKPGIEDVTEAGDFFGATLATGDFNGDGFDDLAIAVPCEAPAGAVSAGAVSVLYGSSVGLRATASGTTPSDQFWTQNSSGVDDAAEDGDGFWSLP
jgi:FG-GAP repeat protein